MNKTVDWYRHTFLTTSLIILGSKDRFGRTVARTEISKEKRTDLYYYGAKWTYRL